MIDERELRELAQVQIETPVLSVYLDVDPTKRTTEEYLLALRSMLKENQERADPEDIAAVQRYFEYEYDWSGRGVILFSCAAADFWRAYPLAVPVASGVTVARRPYLSPLAALMNAYGQCAVVHIDRREAQLFLFQLGELIQTDSFKGEETYKRKKGRGSSSAGRRGGAPASGRHQEEVALRNLREAARVAASFCNRYSPHHLVLAGADPTVAQFRDLLPKDLQEKVIGTIGLDPDTSSAPEIWERAFQVLQQAEEKRKAALVESVFTAAGKGREGVVGLDETLSVAHEGRVRVLIIDRDYHAPGYRCTGCGLLTTQPIETCPFCGGSLAEIPDAAEEAVTRVIEEGGEIEVIDNHPALKQAGVAALLRY